MAIHPWPHLLKRVKKGHALLGLDVGSKTIGVAISDPFFSLASPLVTLHRKKMLQDIAALAELAANRAIGGFVIGLPLHMDGSEGDMAGKIRHFAQQMLEHHAHFAKPPEISFYDERLTTQAMQRFLIEEVDMNRKRRSEVIDKLAAARILQSALDTLRGSGA